MGDCARLVDVEEHHRVLLVPRLHRHACVGQHPIAVNAFDLRDIIRIEFKDRTHGNRAVDPSLAAGGHEEPPGVVLGRIERRGVDRVDPSQGLQERCLAGLVLADEAGDAVADLDRSGVHNVPEVHDLKLVQSHTTSMHNKSDDSRKTA